MKLQTKLIIAFSVIVILMGISQSLFLQSRIESTFEDYLDRQHAGIIDRMQQVLELYYEQTGSWDGVQQLFSSGQISSGQGRGMMMRGMYMNMSLFNVDLILLDVDGTIIADTNESRIGSTGVDFSGIEKRLIVDGEQKGTLVLHQDKLQDLEREFLQSSNIAILISGLIAGVLAVLFSIFIARKISSPLTKLLTGIKRIASGEKDYRVDITTKDEFHELGDAFNEMSSKLARNEEVRRTLVADVAHELRTPLSILQGKLESIQEGAIQASEETILELTDEVYRLNRLVKDLQQLSLAEAGKLPLNRQPVNMKQLLYRICAHLEWAAEEKGMTLRCVEIPDELELNIDADRMTQVFVNLIGNALRHTPEHGSVEVIVEEQIDSVMFHISDTGEGISAEALPFIFDRFYKADPSRSRNDGGTGLGLSIAKGFAEAHDGHITVKSEKNKGTVFTVTLPKK